MSGVRLAAVDSRKPRIIIGDKAYQSRDHVDDFLMINGFAGRTTSGRSSTQNRGTTPFGASIFPTRCTRHHSSSNSAIKRTVSPRRTDSSSSIVGSNSDTTDMRRGSLRPLEEVVSGLGTGESFLASVHAKETVRAGLGGMPLTDEAKDLRGGVGGGTSGTFGYEVCSGCGGGGGMKDLTDMTELSDPRRQSIEAMYAGGGEYCNEALLHFDFVRREGFFFTGAGAGTGFPPIDLTWGTQVVPSAGRAGTSTMGRGFSISMSITEELVEDIECHELKD